MVLTLHLYIPDPGEKRISNYMVVTPVMLDWGPVCCLNNAIDGDTCHLNIFWYLVEASIQRDKNVLDLKRDN